MVADCVLRTGTGSMVSRTFLMAASQGPGKEGREEKRKSEMKFLHLRDTRRGQEKNKRKIINLFLDHQAWDTYPRNVTKVIKTISQTIRYVIKTRIPAARPINSGPKECGSITTREGALS